MTWKAPSSDDWNFSERRQGSKRASGILLAVAVHAVVVWALAQYHPFVAAIRESALSVALLAQSAPPPPQPKPQRLELAPPHAVITDVPVFNVAHPPLAVAVTGPTITAATPARGPVTLSDELAVVCSDRMPPLYPPASRRLRETGLVVLRVELDEQGEVAQVLVKESSGYPRLDEAAQRAVRGWRCTPARRNGIAVRSVALQPISFVLNPG